MVETLIVGGGPAGTAVLLAAARSGALADLAQGGLVIAEAGPRLGAGGLGRYAINSDSTAAGFLTNVTGHPEPGVAAVAAGDAGRAIAALPADAAVPLRLVAALLDELGAALHRVAEQAGAEVLTGHAVLGLQREQHLWVARLQPADGPTVTIAARQVVIATGGVQTAAQVAAVPTVSGPLGARCGARLMRADALLAEGGVDELCARLHGVVRPRVAILGGSASALAAARLVLESAAGARLATGALALVHRRLRPFYPSVDAAHADGFADFGEDDICPVSGTVHGVGGLRLEARDMALHALKIGGRRPDPRLRLVRPAESARGIRALDEAHVVVAATGYRPRALPLTDAGGTPIGLHAAGRGAPPMVDGTCRLVNARGQPLPGLFGIGLAAGFIGNGHAGDLSLWQTEAADLIVRQIRHDAAVVRRQAA